MGLQCTVWGVVCNGTWFDARTIPDDARRLVPPDGDARFMECIPGGASAPVWCWLGARPRPICGGGLFLS